MAYSDYGGYAFRDRARVTERSDAVLIPQGIISTPGMWPGFRLGLGMYRYPYHHVILGDGPIFVGMHKQTMIAVYRMPWIEEPLPDDAFAYAGEDPTLPAGIEIVDVGGVLDWQNQERLRASKDPCELEIDGHRLTIYWRETDNFYQYARLIQPDGTVWLGFSGYGVGCGLEDSADHGGDTEECVRQLFELF